MSFKKPTSLLVIVAVASVQLCTGASAQSAADLVASKMKHSISLKQQRLNEINQAIMF